MKMNCKFRGTLSHRAISQSLLQIEFFHFNTLLVDSLLVVVTILNLKSIRVELVLLSWFGVEFVRRDLNQFSS